MEHEHKATAVTHADDPNAWLYSKKIRLVPKSKYSVNPDDTETTKICTDRHLQCITLNTTTAAGNTAGTLVINNPLVISQLTNPISLQNKEAMESNNLRYKEIERQIEHEEKKKDKTKDLRPAILNMLRRAVATHSHAKREEIAPTCQQFINSKNICLALYQLIHQFKIGVFPNVTFTPRTTQALSPGKFLYADSSTPSNFTVFGFHKQEPNSLNQQMDFLICHLFQEQGQKKSLDDQSIPEASSTRTFGLHWPWNPTPTLCGCIVHILWRRECLHGQTQIPCTPCRM